MEFTKRSFLKSMIAAPALATPALLLSRSDKAVAQTPTAKTYNGTPGFYHYRVGDFKVTALLDGYFEMPTSFIVGYDEKAAKQSTKQSYRRFTSQTVSVPVNAYVINTGKDVVLLGGGAPTFMSPTLGKLSANMAAAGINPADITKILLTHTHPDHVATLIKKDGSKYFDNATLVLSEAEWSFIHNDKVRNAAPKDFKGMIDFARTALAPYKDQRQMFSGEKEVLTGISSSPLPGHTPGHTGYQLHSKGESLFFWGDVVHFSTLQFANPDWKVVFDADVEQARKTRRAIFERASAQKMAIAGAHIDFPGIGYVEKSGSAYRYISAPWMPA
jgi:glyoxylase-like metal-dependent hydrolase (beta-lactamase superfamily II)